MTLNKMFTLNEDETTSLESMLNIMDDYDNECEIALENYKLHPYGKKDGKRLKIMVRSHREGHKTDISKYDPTSSNNVHDLSIKLYNIPVYKNGRKINANGEEFIINRRTDPTTKKKVFDGVDKEQWKKIDRDDDKQILKYFIANYFDELSELWDSMNDIEAKKIFDNLEARFNADKYFKKFK